MSNFIAIYGILLLLHSSTISCTTPLFPYPALPLIIIDPPSSIIFLHCMYSSLSTISLLIGIKNESYSLFNLSIVGAILSSKAKLLNFIFFSLMYCFISTKSIVLPQMSLLTIKSSNILYTLSASPQNKYLIFVIIIFFNSASGT